jgi:CubicO group peptidase (beta-lactamase class C family)
MANSDPAGVAVPRRHVRGRLVMAALVSFLVAACSAPHPGNRPAGPTSQPTVAVARDYWPTAGWRTAAPKDHGIDTAPLGDALTRAAYAHVRSVLLVRHGYLVFEHYRHGLDQSSGHDVRSVTKSVVGALVGIALAEGKIKSLEQTVGELLPAQLPKDADPRVAGVTVRELLTMTSGLPSNAAIIDDAVWNSPDWIRYILSMRLDTDPGSHFAYTDQGAHLLSAIVANAAGQSTLAFARATLFVPLGIRTDGAFEPVLGGKIDQSELDAYQRAGMAWPVDPQGYHYGGAFLRLPARDLAKVGYLYLNGGRWDGTQVIPADYVAAATSPDGSSPNLTAGYGWLWWVGTEDGHRTFAAQGHGGQYIHVVPDLDLVTVITSDPEAGGLDPKALIITTILPAVTR